MHRNVPPPPPSPSSASAPATESEDPVVLTVLYAAPKHFASLSDDICICNSTFLIITDNFVVGDYTYVTRAHFHCTITSYSPFPSISFPLFAPTSITTLPNACSSIFPSSCSFPITSTLNLTQVYLKTVGLAETLKEIQ